MQAAYGLALYMCTSCSVTHVPFLRPCSAIPRFPPRSLPFGHRRPSRGASESLIGDERPPVVRDELQSSRSGTLDGHARMVTLIETQSEMLTKTTSDSGHLIVDVHASQSIPVPPVLPVDVAYRCRSSRFLISGLLPNWANSWLHPFAVSYSNLPLRIDSIRSVSARSSLHDFAAAAAAAGKRPHLPSRPPAVICSRQGGEHHGLSRSTRWLLERVPTRLSLLFSPGPFIPSPSPRTGSAGPTGLSGQSTSSPCASSSPPSTSPPEPSRETPLRIRLRPLARQGERAIC